MTALEQLPSQKNFLNTTGFKLLLKRAPNIQFFVQRINLPSVSIDAPEQQTPFVSLPWPGVQQKYEPLNMSFKVAEDMADYLEIFNWWQGISRAGNLPLQYGPLTKRSVTAGEGVKSDIILMILDSSKNPKFQITYVDAFPSSIGGIDFSSTEDSTDYPVVDVVFQYAWFEIAPV